MDRILLNGLVFFGKHGCHAAEQELGQKFLVDIELECDLRAAGESDSLEDTLDYVAIYNHAREVMEGESAKLLEIRDLPSLGPGLVIVIANGRAGSAA